MPQLSAVVTTFNSAALLRPVLAALGWCDEVLVVDSGSTDRTAEICQEFGCRFIHRDFAGFGPQKRFAVDAAVNDWVFVVDSDEIVSAELQAEIQSLLANNSAQYVGYTTPISLIFLGRLLRFGGEYGKPHLRLFDRRAGNYNANAVHERVVLNGRVGALKGHLWHYSYQSIEHYFEKFNRYTSLGAKQIFDRGKRVSKAYVAFRFSYSFVHLYLIKGLLLDGYAGFVWALLSAFYPVVKYIKLHEMQSTAANQHDLPGLLGCTADRSVVDLAIQPAHPGHAWPARADVPPGASHAA